MVVQAKRWPATGYLELDIKRPESCNSDASFQCHLPGRRKTKRKTVVQTLKEHVKDEFCRHQP